jgi:UTP--glucose-1-phosphate uridylyltransferase
MGAAISLFEGAEALRVPRERFAPVKETMGLLNVRSDNFLLTDDFRIVPNPERTCGDISIDLDPEFYELIDDLEARLPHGVPSLVRCESLTVIGDVIFGGDVTIEGSVRVINESGEQKVVPDGEVLTGELRFS